MDQKKLIFYLQLWAEVNYSECFKLFSLYLKQNVNNTMMQPVNTIRGVILMGFVPEGFCLGGRGVCPRGVYPTPIYSTTLLCQR